MEEAGLRTDIRREPRSGRAQFQSRDGGSRVQDIGEANDINRVVSRPERRRSCGPRASRSTGCRLPPVPSLASLPSGESCMPISNLAQRRRPQAKVPPQGHCTVGARDDIECFERPPRRVAAAPPRADLHLSENPHCSGARCRGRLRARPGSLAPAGSHTDSGSELRSSDSARVLAYADGSSPRIGGAQCTPYLGRFSSACCTPPSRSAIAKTQPQKPSHHRGQRRCQNQRRLSESRTGRSSACRPWRCCMRP
jgi:hypothetical protein